MVGTGSQIRRPKPVDFGEFIRLAVSLPHGGAVAQLGERLNGIQEVDGSTPIQLHQ